MAARSCGSANRYSLNMRRKSGDISASTSLNSSSVIVRAPLERMRKPVQLRDPFICAWAGNAVAGFDLSILADADTNQPGCATDPEALTPPRALHHPRVRGQGRHVQSLERAEDARRRHLAMRAARSWKGRA